MLMSAIIPVCVPVRPALHVDLSSSYVKAAGTVSTESKLTDENIGSQNEADEVIALISAIGTVKKDSKTAIDSARNAYNALPESVKDNVTNYSVLQEAESKYAELIKDDGGNTTGGSTETTSGTTDTGGAGSSVEAGTAVIPTAPGITESVTGPAGSGSTEGSGSATGKAGNGSTTESGAIESPAATSDVSNEGQAAVSSKLESTITSKSFKKTLGCKAFSVAAKTNSDGILEYASDNNKVATISKDGKIKIKGCGKANITITSPETSNYTSSSKTVTVTVLPGKLKLKKISSPKKSQIYFSWSKMQGATEYQYNISETKSFKKARVYSGKENYVKKAAKEASRKTYYVRVRAVTRIDGKKYYGKWSTVKSVEIK